METLDRKRLYIEITGMRSVIWRAKVLVLRKIFRKIKELRKKKCDEEYKIKNEWRVERLINEIKEIKKIIIDAVSKFAIITPPNICEKHIADVESSATIRGLSRLASDKEVVKRVEELKAKYKNWADVSQILKGQRKPKGKVKRNSKKPNLDLEVANLDDDNLETTDQGSSSGDEEEEEQEKDAFQDSDNSVSDDEDVNSHKQNSSLQSTKSAKKNTKCHVSKDMHEKKKQFPELIKKAEGFKSASNVTSTMAVVKRLTNLEDLESLATETSTADLSTAGVTRNDSFFLSAQGEEVESDEEEEESSSDSAESDDDNKHTFNRVYHNRGKAKGDQTKHLGSLKPTEQKLPNKRKQLPQKSLDSKRFDAKSDRKSRQNFQVFSSTIAKTEEKLHPSWEAKRKLKEAIQIGKPQQNKKIKFDD